MDPMDSISNNTLIGTLDLGNRLRQILQPASDPVVQVKGVHLKSAVSS